MGRGEHKYRILKMHLKLKESERESCLVVSDSLQPHGLYIPWNSPGQNTEVGTPTLLQGIFPTQGSNSGLPYCRWILYQLSRKSSNSKKSCLYIDCNRCTHKKEKGIQIQR